MNATVQEISRDQLLRQAAGCLVCSLFGVDVCAVHAPDALEMNAFEEFNTEFYHGPKGFEHCPFCGDLLTLITRNRSSLPVSYNFYCQNPECLLSADRMVNTPDFSSKEEIASLWNQRSLEAKSVVRF